MVAQVQSTNIGSCRPCGKHTHHLGLVPNVFVHTLLTPPPWSCLAMAIIGFSWVFLSFPPYDGLHLLEKQWLTVLLSVADDSKLAASSFLSLETHFAKFHKAIISRSLWLAWKSVSISLSRVINHIPIYPRKYTRSTTKRLKTKCLDR